MIVLHLYAKKYICFKMLKKLINENSILQFIKEIFNLSALEVLNFLKFSDSFNRFYFSKKGNLFDLIFEEFLL